MSDELEIPEFLRIPAEVRAAAWEKNPPKSMPRFGHESNETERRYLEYAAKVKARKRAADQPRFEAMRAKAKANKDQLKAVREAAAKASRLRRSKFTPRVRKS